MKMLALGMIVAILCIFSIQVIWYVLSYYDILHLPDPLSIAKDEPCNRRNIQEQMEYKDAIDMLHREGFTASEINRLIQLRRDYTAKEIQKQR
jgi:hypothetical protein